MKIGSRIALFYTIITVGAIAAVVMVFYFFTSRYINHLYDSYLIEKAYLTAQKHWEKDEVDEYSYREIQQKYDELLPQAQEILLNTDSASAAVNDTLNKYLDSNQQARLFKDFPVPFVYGNLRVPPSTIPTMKATSSYWSWQAIITDATFRNTSSCSPCSCC